jgi:hypothetical protein
MTTLALRSIGSNDYAVIDDGDRVGRIRLAAERRGEVWMWNIGLNIPGGVPSGTAGEPRGRQDGVPRVLDKVQGGE